MSRIDSGLGWSCDSSYYCADTTTVVVKNGTYEAHKATAGGAIVVNVQLSNGWWSCAVLSTVQEYAQTDNSENASVHTAYNGSITYDGLTWYLYIQGAGRQSSQTSFPEVQVNNGETIGEPGYMPLTIEAILTAAGVEAEVSDKIPTTDYVKTFVQGVEAETATRVNANKAAIGTLSNLTTTVKTDIVSAVNEVNDSAEKKKITSVKCNPVSEGDDFATKTWTGLTSFNGGYVWTDGDNIYYSNSSTQYVLNKATSTWSAKTWTGLTSFMGSYIWTYGENIYYSKGSDQYVLDKATSTWTAKTWTGLTSLYGNSVWTDGDNIYYSNGSDHYVLDKSTLTWSTKTWTGLQDVTFFMSSSIWTDGDNIYYSSGSDQYVLDKSTSTWSVKTWTGLKIFDGDKVWTDGDNIYYSKGSKQYVLNKNITPNMDLYKNTISYINRVKQDKILSTPIIVDGVSNTTVESALNAVNSVVNGFNKTESVKCTLVNKGVDFKPFQWYVKLNDLDAFHIWTYGENIYYSNTRTHYVLDKSTLTWSTKTWTGLTQFLGCHIWTDGINIYYSYQLTQYVLDTATSTWSAKTWTGLTSFMGLYIWTYGENIYYSKGSDQYVLDKATSTWTAKTWTGLTSFDGDKVWTDGDNIYYSGGGSSDHYVLDKSTSTWSAKTWSGWTYFSGAYIWMDSHNNVYMSDGIRQKVLNKSTSTWSDKMWYGYSGFAANDIWSIGNTIYVSDDDDQYILDEYISTWSAKIWTRLTRLTGSSIWTDGDNIYYSSGPDQYVLDKSTST